MKAISIALVPVDVSDLQRLITFSMMDEKGGHFLDSKHQLPHVTLAMGLMNETQRESVVKEVRSWAEIQVKTTHVSILKREIEPDLVWLNLERNEQLMRLHEKAMDLLALQELPPATPHFALPDHLSGREVAYVRDFQAYAHEQYKPHMTLGYGELPSRKVPNIGRFRAGVFHLGPSCTCHTELS